MNNFAQLFLQIPWWVYLLFAYILFVGFKATRPGTVSIKKLIIIPAIFTYLSLHTLIAQIGINYFSVSFSIVAWLIGITFGYYQIYRLKITTDRKNLLVNMPGTWSTLIILLIIFSSKFYFGFKLGVDPEIIQHTGFVVSMLLVSGICTGMLIGRLLRVMQLMSITHKTQLNSN